MAGSPTRTTRRADAEQNAERILEAATSCLSQSPNASVSEIASVAGLGRVTIYGHFPSREAIIEATLIRLLRQGDQELSQLDLSGEPREALVRLTETSWRLTARSGNVLEAAQAVLSPERIRELHTQQADRVDRLVDRGQRERAFRTDLPRAWLVNLLHHVLKGAAVDLSSGQLDAADASRIVTATVLAAFTCDPAAGKPTSLASDRGRAPSARRQPSAS